MSQQTLLLVEATGIQEYIFGSNQLAQNIGASELVQQATTDWVFELLPQPHNVERDDNEPDGWKVDNRSLVSDNLAAEVIYAGGGNAMILFAQDPAAKDFAQRLTRRVLERAPSLGIVLKRKSFNPEQDALADVHQALRGELAQRKLSRPASVPLLGLGVTAACRFTGAPAVKEWGQERVLVSAEIQAKLKAEGAGKERLKRHLNQEDLALAGYDFVYNFDDLGSRGTSSYLAVIHTDGNDMGERIKKIGKDYPVPTDNAAYARKLRAFSASVASAARTALNRTLTMLIAPANLVKERDENGRDTTKIGGVVPIPERDGKDILPFRPIVFGGDDVTFVCEGRLGLEVAAKYLEEFSGQILDDRERAYARAGVAIAKTHYPFSRTYELAEALCKSAKSYIKDLAEKEEEGVTALDWHFAVGGLVLPLKEVRRREYTAKNGHSLLMRPVHLGYLQNEWRSWSTFTQLTETFLKRRDWAGRRNKVKALRDALRDGPDAVKLLVQMIRKPKAVPPLPAIPGRPEMQEQGWQGKECGYFDAVEAMDFFVGLEGGATA